MCYNIISLYFGQKSLYYFALYCFVSLSPTLISWLHICSFLQSLGPTRQPCAFTWELNLLIWIIVTVSLLQKVLNKHSKNHEYLGFSDAGIVEANNVAMLVFWSTPLICSIAGCHWYTSLGEDLREKIEMLKIHEMLAHPQPVEETIEKKEIQTMLECPVCLDQIKPPLQVEQTYIAHN